MEEESIIATKTSDVYFKLSGRRIATIGAFVILAVAGAAWFAISNPIIRYPAFAVGAGGVSYLLWEIGEEKKQRSWRQSNGKLADSLSLLFLATIPFIVAQSPTQSPPDVIYPIILAAVAITTIRCLRTDYHIGIPILIALLSNLLVRGIHYWSAPVVGQDSKRHLAAASYMAATGEPIPNDITYYSDYPISHAFSATTELLLSVPTKQAWLFSVTLGYVFLLIGVYCLTKRITNEKGVAVIAIFFAGLSSGSLRYAYQAHAQAMGEALLLTIVVGLGLQDVRKRASVLFFGLVAIIAQNLIPLVIAGVAIVAVLTSRLELIIGRLWPERANETPPLNISSLTFVGMVSVLSAIVYWIETSYLHYQVARVMGIIIPSAGLESEVSTGTPPTVSFFGFTPPGLLVEAAPLLVVAAALVCVGLMLFSYLDRMQDPRPLVWSTIFAEILFGIWGLSLFSGGGSAVGRASGAVAIFIAPILALCFAWQGRKHVIGVILAVLLVSSVVTAGVIGSSYLERPEEEFSPIATNGEMAAVGWAESYTKFIHSDGYLTSAAYWKQVGTLGDSTVLNGTANHKDPESFLHMESVAMEKNQPILYRDKWRVQHRFNPSPTTVLYDSGNTTVILVENRDMNV